MNLFDLSKATVVCGGIAFLFFSYPVLGQALMIAVMSVVWLSYARKAVLAMQRRKAA